MGQTSHASVVVQGGGSTRRVAAFCSHPDELQVSPDRLTLPPGALTEINLAFRPLIPGRLDVAVHLVDLEKGELVHSRLVATDARGPVVSKTYDVDALFREMTREEREREQKEVSTGFALLRFMSA